MQVIKVHSAIRDYEVKFLRIRLIFFAAFEGNSQSFLRNR